MATQKVRWAELFPDEFLNRAHSCPIVYLPLGICEPHGHISVFGLDTIKADFLCDEAAKRFGGIVAPTQAYQIHEVGYHAPWLQEVMGNQNGFMTSMPSAVVLHFFLYQLRAFYNAGFGGAFVITGHSGGNQNDFRAVADLFFEATNFKTLVFADPELAGDKYTSDHAGKYEISQSLYLKPETIKMEFINEATNGNPLGRFAQGENASEASAEYGKEIFEDSFITIEKHLQSNFFPKFDASKTPLSITETEVIWEKVKTLNWETFKLREGQIEVPKDSRWHKAIQ